ncbi:hypothetical protein ACDA63_18775 [Uliginosibacterium sp. sgz301328]|uniref:hypothetical protein n=1 Tax=Uliginosibacterium sp. sgz301328 TaxID=3243764 RepID=UPI00359EC558
MAYELFLKDFTTYQTPTKFVRVFDVVRVDPPLLARNREVKTLFSFEDDIGRHIGLSVAGLPRLEPGMRVIALLSRENDWQSLIGWLDLDTGEIAGIDSWNIGCALVMCLGAVGVLLMIVFTSDWSSLKSIAFWAWSCITGAGFLVWAAAYLRRLLMARSALRGLAAVAAPLVNRQG